MGIIGFGSIGSYLYNKIKDHRSIDVGFVYEVVKERTSGLKKSLLIDSPEELVKRHTDLVIEAADFHAVSELAPKVLKETDI